jgi:hypothetical protein
LDLKKNSFRLLLRKMRRRIPKKEKARILKLKSRGSSRALKRDKNQEGKIKAKKNRGQRAMNLLRKKKRSHIYQ